MTMNDVKFDALIGKILLSVDGNVGSDAMNFTTADGEIYQLYHGQDCCESVYIESIVGDISDLIGSPILAAEEVSSQENPRDIRKEFESVTWTFYKLATIKGYVDIRWCGESNGYYSENVDFKRVK